MNINTKIENALKDVCSNIWPLVCPDKNPPEAYITYNPEIEEAGLFADDEDLEWILQYQVHFFTKKNYIKERKIIREKLKCAGFIVKDIDINYESYTHYNHLTFTIEMEEE